MARRVLVALLWVLAVVAGVAIAALSHTLCSPSPDRALLLLRQPAVDAALLAVAAVPVAALWYRRQAGP